MALKLVVFDLDGTLVTAEIDFMAMRNAIRDLLNSHGIPSETLPMHSTQDLLRSAFIYASEKGMSPVEMSTLRDKIYHVATKIEWEGAHKAQLVLGAKETLVELQCRGVHIGVLTNDNRQVADFLLKKHQLTAYVEKLVSRDEAPHMKPSTEGLKMILRYFEVDSAKTIFVGDSKIDVMTANKLGIKCVARLSKGKLENELKAEGAIAIFPTLEAIIPYFEKQGFLSPPSKVQSKNT